MDITTPFLLCHTRDDEDHNDGERQYMEAIMVMEKGGSVYSTLNDFNDDDLIGKAMLSLLALYFVYDLDYPPSVKNTFFFVQQFVLGVSELTGSHSHYDSVVNRYLTFINLNRSKQ